jgi:hypothetical protein
VHPPANTDATTSRRIMRMDPSVRDNTPAAPKNTP